MRDCCDDAGLPDCSSQGLGKACARRPAKAGCTHHDIKAITGHKTDADVRPCVARAGQVLPARNGFEKLQGSTSNL
jgi:hypothetical protein